MFALVCLAIVLIIICIAIKYKPKIKPDMVLVQAELWKMVEIMQERWDDRKNWKLRKQFVTLCYDLHSMTWWPYAVARKNFSSRINRIGYIQAINKKPVYLTYKKHGKTYN